MFRNVAGGITALLLAAGSLSVGASSANAVTPGCYTTHCYATLRGGDGSAVQYAGMYGIWNRAAMTTDCPTNTAAQPWMNSEMWFWPFGNDGSGWVEAGHTGGWLDPGGSCDYYAFVAWQRQDGTGYSERMLARLDHSDTTTDEFQISRSGTTNVFYGYFNGTRVTTSNVQFWATRRGQVGGEVHTNNGTSNTFNMRVRMMNSIGTRYYLPTPHTQNLDDPPLTASSPRNSEWNWRVRP